MLKAQHYVKPDIYPFYDLEHGMKKGGKRRRAKRKSTRKSHSKPITNQNIIKINIGGAYEKMNKRKQFQAPRRIMANAPKALRDSQYAVPNSTSYFRMSAPRSFSASVDRIPTDPVKVERPNTVGVPTFAQNENRSGIEPVSSKAQRAIPTPFGEHQGGVFSNAPESLVKQEYSPPPLEDYAKASVNYFKTTGRDNIPAPVDRQTTAAKPADFFPLRGQAAPSRNTEMARQLGIGSVVHATIPPSPAYGFADISTPVRGRSRYRSPSIARRARSPSIARDEEFYSPSQAKSSAHGEAISLTKRASSAARASMNTLHEEEAMPSKRHGGKVRHSVFH